MSTTAFTMPAGCYYVGDLCYVMHPQWSEFCDKSLANEGLVVLDNGVRTAQFGTMYGDGCYQDESGNEYPVDSGLIGCIRVEDILDADGDLGGGQVFDFSSDFKCFEIDGVMHFGHIRINTGDEEKEFEENVEDEDSPEDENQ